MTFTSPVSEDDLQRQVILMLKTSFYLIRYTITVPTKVCEKFSLK